MAAVQQSSQQLVQSLKQELEATKTQVAEKTAELRGLVDANLALKQELGKLQEAAKEAAEAEGKRKAETVPAPQKQEKAEQNRPRERKLKFSFKEQREFETIEGDIAELERQIADCEAAQSACGSDYVKLQELTERQTALEAALEEKMDRWVYLTDLKERIDAQ